VTIALGSGRGISIAGISIALGHGAGKSGVREEKGVSKKCDLERSEKCDLREQRSAILRMFIVSLPPLPPVRHMIASGRDPA
jgi:hypothetical protein